VYVPGFRVTANDIADFVHVEAVPYVDAVTMDRRTADLCRRVIDRLKRVHGNMPYEGRVFSNLKDLIHTKLGLTL
jgi:hypothetical protein